MILITGGIGSGKSVVSAILRAMGYTVYDCDSRARLLMDNSDEIKQSLRSLIHPHAVNSDGIIDRPLLASIVFSDSAKLACLNSIVHQAVRADISRQVALCPDLFVETAIPVSSRLFSIADEIWQVEAPESVRIARVMARNNLSADQVRQRIDSQLSESISNAIPIINDNLHPLLPRIHRLLNA